MSWSTEVTLQPLLFATQATSISRQPGEAHVVRDDLGTAPPHGAPTSLLRLVHVSDLHVMDAASPARGEWVELCGDDPLWRPLLHMHRPYEALALHALVAHVRTVAANPVSPLSSAPFDLVLSTGDNIDNAQRNELDAYLVAMASGVAQLDVTGSALDTSSGAFDGTWPFWAPDGRHDNDWSRAGFPVVEAFIERASAPLTSPGWGVAWTSVPGNHDLLRQGTALTTAALERIAVGATKSLRQPAGFVPRDSLEAFLDTPELFSDGPGYPLAAVPERRVIDRTEWLAAHAFHGATGYENYDAMISAGTIDTVIDRDAVRLILVDTNHPHGDFQGSIGAAQLAWLDERLTEVDQDPERVAILVSHHGADTLVNERGNPPDRLLAEALYDVAHRHPSLIAWLVGHRHINRIEPRRGAAGGFWEITTSSIIDWPSQARAIEVLRHHDDTIEIVCTMLDHDDDPQGLASLHRDLSCRFAGPRNAAHRSGRIEDRNARLMLAPATSLSGLRARY